MNKPVTKIVAIIVIIAAFIIGLIAFLFSGRNSESGDVIVSSEGGGTCFVTNFSTDGDIEISLLASTNDENGDVGGEYSYDTWVGEDPSTWRVRDLSGKDVNTKVNIKNDKVIIKAPEGGYESGGIYFLDIGPNARFSDKRYGESRHMVFGVDREESETIVFQENVYQNENKPFELDGNTITLEGEYKEGDIVIGDFDGDKFEEAVKLKDVQSSGGKTTATVEDPDVEEVYEELDIFTVKTVDFSNGETAEGIEESAEIGFLDLLGSPVYADENESDDAFKNWKLNVDYKTKKKSVDGVNYDAPYLNMSLAYKEDLTDITIDFDVMAVVVVVAQLDELKAYASVDLENQNKIHLNVGKSLEINVGKLTTEEMLAQYQENKKAKASKLGGKKDIKSDIPIPIGPITIFMDLFASVDVDLAAQFDTELSTDAGFFAYGWYDINLLSDNEYEANHEAWLKSEFKSELSGMAELFAGPGARLYVGIPKIAELGINGKVGPYAELDGAVSCEGAMGVGIEPTFSVNKGMIKLSGGLKADAYIDIDSGLLDEPVTLYDIPEYKKELVGFEIDMIEEIAGAKEEAAKETEGEEGKSSSAGNNNSIAWIIEPTGEYTNINVITAAGGGNVSAKPYSEFNNGTIIKMKNGYPQQWYEKNPEGVEGAVEYSADSISVSNSNGEWGIIDYNGNVLMDMKATLIDDSSVKAVLNASGIDVSSAIGSVIGGGIGYTTIDAYTQNGTAENTSHILSADYKEEISQYSYDTVSLMGGGPPVYFFYICDGKLYRIDFGTGNEEKPLTEELNHSLIRLSPTTEGAMDYIKDSPNNSVRYCYVDGNGGFIEQEAYIDSNSAYYVNGYYHGYEKGMYDKTDDDKIAIVHAASGKPITSFIYEDALFFEEGYCPVKRDGKWGFIDSTGKEVTEMIFDKVSTVYDGKVAVIIDGKFAIINIKDTVAGGILTKEILYEAASAKEAEIAAETANEKQDVLLDEETNEILNAVKGTWAEDNTSEQKYVLNGLDLLLTGFDSTYNNEENGYRMKVTEVYPQDRDGKEAYILAVPYSDDFALWSLVIYKEDIRRGKCERIYAVHRSRGGQMYEDELLRVD